MNEENAAIVVDLARMAIDATAEPERSWLLTSRPRDLKREDLSRFFLVSIPPPKGSGPAADMARAMLARGNATSLEEASRFFEDALAGRAAADAAGRAARLLQRQATISREAKFKEERAVFAAQFEEASPFQGLRGFLEKNSAPFTLAAKNAQSLKAVAQWLTRAIGNSH